MTDRPELLIKCHLYHENYGPDHRATYSEWNLQPQSKPNDKARKAYKRADWARIGEEVARKMSPWKDIKTRPTLDRVVEKLILATAQAVDQFTPDTRPTPYSKRWFTPDLKPRETWGCTPALKVGSEELTQNEDKAKAFLEAFFPAMNTPDPSPPTSPQPELPWHSITELEIKRSLKTTKGTTALGEDNLPMLV
ncbi:reverse transcriptase [Penicillium sp. IBT 16267x]|nr:reverse transcriptase [Penicillium sp. IBT 16267x]